MIRVVDSWRDFELHLVLESENESELSGLAERLPEGGKVEAISGKYILEVNENDVNTIINSFFSGIDIDEDGIDGIVHLVSD